MDQYYGKGSAALWWLGQMGLMVRMGDTLVCIDYFATPSDDRQVPPPVPTEEVTGVHAFLGSHNHRDHIDTDAWKVWAGTNADACFVFPGYHMAELQAQGIPGKRCVGLNDGACCRIGEITIRAIAADGPDFICEEFQAAPSTLTARELDVLREVARGKQREAIASALGIGAESVKTHLKGIMTKLGCPNATSAVSRAYELGILRA